MNGTSTASGLAIASRSSSRLGSLARNREPPPRQGFAGLRAFVPGEQMLDHAAHIFQGIRLPEPRNRMQMLGQHRGIGVPGRKRKGNLPGQKLVGDHGAGIAA